jgi:CBS domain-containing protein
MFEKPELTPISSTGRLPISPSMEPVLASAHVPQVSAVIGPRVIFISALALGVAFAAGVIARALVAAIALVTNAAFLGIGRLPVVSRTDSSKVVGILTRSDLLSAHARRLTENDPMHPRLRLPFVRIARI